MTPEDLPNCLSDDLRRRAMERVAEHVRIAVSRCGNDTRRLLQEMERYNIELELQLEKLRHNKVDRESCRNSRV